MSTPFVTDTIGTPSNSSGHEAITPNDTATGITASILEDSSGKKAKGAFITVEDNNINFSVHGTDPTAKAGSNVGHQLSAGQNYTMSDPDEVANFKCIDRVSGEVGIVKVTVYYPS